MKTLEIILRLIDNLLTAIKFRKAQNDRNELEKNPADWFTNHFGGVSESANKTDKATSAGDTAD